MLMEESKLTMLQRKRIQEVVDKGESLPTSVDRTKEDKDKTEDNRVNIATQCGEEFPENYSKKISRNPSFYRLNRLASGGSAPRTRL